MAVSILNNQWGSADTYPKGSVAKAPLTSLRGSPQAKRDNLSR
jgi:hypothetical protein